MTSDRRRPTRRDRERSRRCADDLWSRIDWSRYQYDYFDGGRRVHFVDIGAGPAVVLIHGQGGSWQFWLRVIPSLARSCRVIAIDLPGFGESDAVPESSVMDEQLATVTGVLRHLGLARAVVVGHSMGGLVTVRATADHPELIAGAVLVNAGGHPVGATRLASIMQAFRVVNAVLRIGVLTRFIADHDALRNIMFSLAVADRNAVSSVLAREILPRMAGPGFIATMKAAADALGGSRLEEVTRPTLVVWGECDRVLPLAAGRTLAERIPGARLVTIADTGHCPMIECPDEFVVLVGDFVVGAVRHRSAPPPPARNHVSWSGNCNT